MTEDANFRVIGIETALLFVSLMTLDGSAVMSVVMILLLSLSFLGIIVKNSILLMGVIKQNAKRTLRLKML